MKRTWLEKILIWILAVTMVVTNVDVTAFTAAAEELIIEEDAEEAQQPQEEYAAPETEPVFEITDVEMIEGGGQQAQEDAVQTEEQPQEDAVQSEEQPQENVVQPEEQPLEDAVQIPEAEPESEASSEDVLQDDSAVSDGQDDVIVESIDEIEPEEGLPVDEEQIGEELADMAADNIQPFAATRPVWYAYMQYWKDGAYRNIDVTYSYKGVNHKDTHYVWIYGAGGTGEKRIAYCIEPGVVSNLQGQYTKHNKSLMDHSNFKNDPEKARRIMEYAYFGIEYPSDHLAGGHWASNEVGVEFFAAAQELIWEEIGVTNISWHLQSGGTLDTKVDQRKARIKTLIAEYRAKPEFESATLYQDKTQPDKTYTMKLKSNSVDLTSWNLNTNKLPKGVKNVVKHGRDIQFKLDPKVTVTTVKFEFTKTAPNNFNMFYYTAPGQQTLIVVGALPSLSCECSEKVIPVSRVRIKKTDDAGKPVQGVTFRYGTSKTKLDKKTKATDVNGETEITINLAGVNTIYVQELDVPPHLVKSDEIKAVTFTTGGVGTVTFVNDRVRRAVSLKKVDSKTGEPLAGAVFRYYESDRPETKYTAVTDENGSFTSTVKFLPGVLVAMEEISVPSGYETPMPPYNRQEIRIDMDESKNVFKFSNTPKDAKLLVEKYNERTGDPVRDGVGCKFRVSTSLSHVMNDTGGNIVELKNNGIADLGKYAHGTTVFFKEIEAPPGYELNKKIRWARIDATETTEQKIAVNTVRVPNTQITVQLRLKKKGSDGRPLEGVRFRLEQRTDRGKWYTVASNLVTDKNGKVDIPGTYEITLLIEERLRLVEEETIPGYKLLDGPVVLGEEYAQETSPIIEIEQSNEKIPTRFTVYKYDEESKLPLAGAVFEITDEDGDLVQTITTNSRGYAETTELLTDVTYYIEEIEAPRGYQKAEGRKSFVISSEGEENSFGEYFLQREYPNKPYKGRIKVKKTNQDGIALAGIEFTIYKGTKVVQRLTTNEAGYAESDWLNADSEYRIRETYTPPQFDKTELLDYTFDFLNMESQVVGKNWRVDVTKNEAGNEITASFEVTNKELRGCVTVKKVDADDPSFVVQGATFELYNRYDRNNLLARGVTDETGTVVFDDLPIVNPIVNMRQGHYYLEETTPGANHILPEHTGIYFSLTADQLDYEVTFKNPPFKGSVEILKVDRDDPEKKLEGAEFAIYRAEDLNTILKTAITGRDGIALFEDLRYGEYVIKETKAPLYYRNNLKDGGNTEYWDPEVKGYKVTISENGQVIPLKITNAKLQISISVVKYAKGRYATLGGAEFELRTQDGKVLETLITSSVDGTARSETYSADQLGEGAYLVETKAPAGYEASTEPIPIEFTDQSDTAILEIVKEVENDIQESKFRFKKVDEYGNGVAAEFTIEVYNITKDIDWYRSYEAQYWFETTNDNTFADMSEFNNWFQNILMRHGDNSYNDSYKLTFSEISADDKHQPIKGILGELKYYLTSSGWTAETYTSLKEGVTFDDATMILTVVNRSIPVRLNVKKTDYSDKYLAGAVFKITPDGQEEKAVEVISTDDPNGVMVELPYAEKYIVEEIVAPPGYFRSREKVTVKASDLQLDKSEPIWFYHGSTSIGDTLQPEFVIKKIGSDQKPLKATFRITEIQNQYGLNQEITVSTQESDGTIRVDLSPFSEFMDISYADGIFKIEEISVEDADYQLLEQPVYVKWITERTKWTFDTTVAGYENPESVSFDMGENSILITVPNKKKNYRYRMMKQGDPNDSNKVWADIILSANGNEKRLMIASDSPQDVSDFFISLTGSEGYLVRIEEKGTTEGYGKVPLMSFRYYPDNSGGEKFQDINGPISIDMDGELITIKITNKLSKMRLRIKKTDSYGQMLGGARFKVTTQNPSFEKEYVTTGDPDGEIFEFPYAQNIQLEEIEAPPGYEMGETSRWSFTANDFQPIDPTNSVYECDRFLTDPIVNRSTYDLTVKKTDGDGQTSNAVFKMIGAGGVSGTWEVTTTEGSASLNPIVDELLKQYPDRNSAELIVTEIAADKGLLLQKGNLAKIVVHLDRIKGKASGQYFELQDYDSSSIGVEVGDTGLEFTVKNEFIPVNLTLIKKEKDKETYLAGAEFTVTANGGKADGKQIKVETDGTSKGKTVSLPWAESYSVQETRAPEGYILDPTVYDYTLEEFKSQMDESGTVLLAKNLSVLKENTAITGSLRIRKVDAQNGASLSGAVFEIRKGAPPESYDEAGTDKYELVDRIAIGSDGTGGYNNLLYGAYFLREIKPPQDYGLSKELIPFAIKQVMQTVELDVPNRRLEGSLTIRKVDQENNQTPLAGAVFTIHRQGTDEQVGDELVTDVQGKIGPVSLPYGEYYIKEVRFPAGYVSATGKTYPFELNQTQNVHVETIGNTKAQYGLRIYKRDGETRKMLAGAVFGVFKDGETPQANEPIVTFRSNASGIATVLLSEPNDYDVYELVPPAGYRPRTEKIDVHVDDTTPTIELDIDNYRQMLTIEIIKQEEETAKPLAGAVFEIRNERTGTLVATTDPTGDNGKVTVVVPAGDHTYTVTEIKAPDGYVLDSTPHTVTVKKGEDGDGNITYEAEPLVIGNKLIQGNIRLLKVDATDKQTPLAGAVFEVRNESGETVDELTTNSQGEAMSKELPYGKYTLVETKAPEGYELDNMTPHQVELSKEQTLVTVTAENTPKKGGFTVRKVDAEHAEKVLAGAEFTIFKSYEDAQNLQKEVGKQTTGTDGLASFQDLDYGTYYVRETKAPKGYQLNDRIMAVTVDQDWQSAPPLVAVDYEQPEKGYFRVVKTDKETGIGLAGAQFTVTGPDNYEKVYTTDQRGMFQTELLTPGTYTVTETKAPEGYYLSDEQERTKTVEVVAGAGTLVEMQELIFENEQILLPIHIKKTDDAQEPKPLVGAEFKIYRLDENGERIEPEIETLVTDMYGEAASKLLPTGSYEVVETAPPKGYELAKNPSQKVTIDAESTGETLTFDFVNTVKRGDLKIKKVDANDPNKVLSGAVFEAYGIESGITYKETSGEDGYAVFKDLPYGNYRVRELEAPEGYERNDTFEEYITVGEDSPEGGTAIEIVAPNTPLKGRIQLTKKDALTGEMIDGAVYGIYTGLLENGDIDPNTYMGETYDLVSKAPNVTSKELDYGMYYVREKTPPAGYKVNEEVYPVVFRENIPLVTIDAVDEPYRGSVSVEKRDGATKKPLAGAIFAVFTAEEYKEYQQTGNSAHELSPVYLVTNEEGKASSGEVLLLGQEYVMTEYAPPAGYDPPTQEDGSEKVWRFTPTEEELIFLYEIDNTKRSEIVIHKKDENGSPVSGVVFGLYTYGDDGKAETGDDKEIAQFGTAIDGSGIARFDTKDLANGWYYVKELSCGTLSYELSKEIVPIEITADKREYEFDFVNYRARAEVAIQKRDEYGSPLAGARFGLYKYTPDWQEKTDFENDLIEEFKLDEKGYGKIEDLICDLYVLREIEAPAGYRRMEPVLVDLLDMADKLDPPDYPDAEVPESEAAQAEAYETSDTGQEGFGQAHSRKRDDQIHVTKGEKNGRTYYYYHHDLYNEPLTGWIEIQKEGAFDDGSLASGMDLSGARFELRDGSGKLVDTVTTNQDGRGRSRELPLGTYTITETVAPDGTQLNEKTGTVVIDGNGADDVYTYTHTNSVVMGQIRIKKTDPLGKLLTGAEFDIYAEDSPEGESGELVDHLTTGEDGTATSGLLPYGWYIIRETKSPDGYTFDPNLRLRCRISESGQTVELTVLNYPSNEPGVYVVKYDKDDLNHYLANAHFTLYKDEDLTEQIETYTTDETGQLKITDKEKLIEGETYYLKETAAPEGYQLDETVHSFVWGETTTIALYIPNEKEKGYIRFEKTGEMLSEIRDDSSYPNLKELVWEQQQLENAQIGIYATGEVALDGKKYQKGDLILKLGSGQTSTALPLGTYEYQELLAPPSYVLDTQRYPIEVTKGTTELNPTLVTMKNTHAGVRLELYKKFGDDENTEENFKQVRFGVYTADTIAGGKAEIAPETLVGVFGVNENGFAEPKLKLPEGLYYVRELETADGYALDPTRYPFKAVYNNENETIIISTKEEPIVNEPLYGVIRLEKKGELFTQVETSIAENKYQVNRPVFTQGELYGAKVEIRTTEAVTIDGTTYEKGAVVDTLVSGEKPESRGLPAGTYEAVEVEAPEGYVLDDTPQKIIIEPQQNGNQVQIVELSFTNAKKKVDLKLYKSFFGTEEAEAKKLYGKVLFGVYAAEDIRGAADGVILRKDTLVALIRMQEDGSGGIEKGMLPAGSYYVKELETAEGYQLDETEYPFTVSFAQNDPSDGNTEQAADTITVEVAGIDEEHPVMNLPDGALTPFAFRKVDEEGRPLAGAVFRLYYCRNKEPDHTHSELAGEAGSCWAEIAGLSPRTSGADGVVDFGLLPDGTYQLRETEAPNGYVLPAGQWRITVDSSSPAAEHITITAAGDVQPPAFERADGEDVYQYQVSNRKVRDLPFTGGAGILGYIGGGSALLAASGFLRKRKKKNKKAQ